MLTVRVIVGFEETIQGQFIFPKIISADFCKVKQRSGRWNTDCWIGKRIDWMYVLLLGRMTENAVIVYSWFLICLTRVKLCIHLALLLFRNELIGVVRH